MDNHFIVTPYFIDQEAPNLYSFVQDGWQVNTVALPEGDPQDKASAVHKPLADIVEAACKSSKRPISVAGDCCATIPVMAGLQRAGLEPTFLWLDAHGDFNTWETTPSGFLGGMPLAMIAGLGDLRMNEAVGLRPIPQEKIILADGRDLDPGERKLVENSSITHIETVDKLKEISSEGPVYIHFDTDILHLDDLSAVKYPAKGGPRLHELADVFHHLRANLDIVAVSTTIGVWKEDSERVKEEEKTAWDLLGLLF